MIQGEYPPKFRVRINKLNRGEMALSFGLLHKDDETCLMIELFKVIIAIGVLY